MFHFAVRNLTTPRRSRRRRSMASSCEYVWIFTFHSPAGAIIFVVCFFPVTKLQRFEGMVFPSFRSEPCRALSSALRRGRRPQFHHRLGKRCLRPLGRVGWLRGCLLPVRADRFRNSLSCCVRRSRRSQERLDLFQVSREPRGIGLVKCAFCSTFVILTNRPTLCYMPNLWQNYQRKTNA
jgi:hypothetical protein